MDRTLKQKHNLMLEIEQHERALIELSKWSIGQDLSESTRKLTGEISSEKQKNELMRTFEYVCSLAKEEKNGNGDKLYLSEIVEMEKPKFNSNNLILAPTGSGKSHFMKSLINTEEVLLLVSTSSLKDSLVPETIEERKKLASRMYTTSRKDLYGDMNYNILVMTYKQFGDKIKYTDDFANKYSQIFCDEIHSLFSYYAIDSEASLLGAMKYLFAVKENQSKYYFTATDEHLENFKKTSESLFNNLNVLNYLDHPKIIKHLTLSSYEITGLEQVRPHLVARKESFKYFNYKVFAFCKTIKSQLYLQEIMEKEGFNPLVLWSINNEDTPLSEEQIRQRAYILRTGLIPDDYDSLIINASMQEGWDLLDPKVKLVVMNTTNKTEFVQALGRVRGDVDVLVYRVDSLERNYYIKLPEEMIDVPLTTSMKTDFCNDLNIKNEYGRQLKWTTIKKELENQGYVIEDKIIVIEGKRTRVSYIRLPKIAV